LQKSIQSIWKNVLKLIVLVKKIAFDYAFEEKQADGVRAQCAYNARLGVFAAQEKQFPCMRLEK
jgi:hypothetical protein